MNQDIISTYLGLLDSQRLAAFSALEGLGEIHIWQRPSPKSWCIGEILSHTVRFYQSFLPFLVLNWKLMSWFGRLRQNRPYSVTIDDVYKRPSFPMWTGFLWSPSHHIKKPTSLPVLKFELESTHASVKAFYSGKDSDVLGNVYAWDPAIGVVNMITALKVGLDHDHLHYQDVIKQAEKLKTSFYINRWHSSCSAYSS